MKLYEKKYIYMSTIFLDKHFNILILFSYRLLLSFP